MKILNKKFQKNYEEIERYEAGISLTGDEVKSIKLGRIKLEDAYVKIKEKGVFLVNAEIPPYSCSFSKNYDPRRNRPLLLHKKEITRLKTKLKSSTGLTIIPIMCYNNKKGLIKIVIALARGRKKQEKKKLEKRKEIEKEEKKKIKEALKTWG